MANLLKNPNFETPSGVGPTKFTGISGGGDSAAANWTVFNNTNGTTTTELFPSTAPNGRKNMLHVDTTGERNGIVQVFGDQNAGPQKVESSIWVFILKGEVGMGTGNGGDTGLDTVEAEVGRWKKLHAPNGKSPANEFIVYAASKEGANYYLDSASVED